MATLRDLPQSIAGPLGQYYVNLPSMSGLSGMGDNGVSAPYTDEASARAWYEAMYGPLGPQGRIDYGGTRQGWKIDPQWGITPDETQVMIEEVRPDGSYIVKAKTGDKEGTLYQYRPNASGGYDLNPEAVGTVPWDTNEFQRMRNILLPAAIGAGVGGAAAFGGAGSGGLSGGALGAGETIGATDALANAGWGAEAANAGLGVGGMAGGAWSTPGLTTAATAGGLPLPAVTNIADVFSSGAIPTSVSVPSPTNISVPSPTDAGATEPVSSLIPNLPSNPTGGLLSNLPDWLKLVLGLGGAGISAWDANRNNNQTTGYQPSIDVLTERMKQSPLDRTALSGLIGQGIPYYQPQFSTKFYTPQFSTTNPYARTGLMGG